MGDEIPDIPMDEFEAMMDMVHSKLAEPDLSDEDFIKLLREVDEPGALYTDYDIDDIRKVPPPEREDFFKFFLGMVFIRLVDQEGGTETLDKAGLIRVTDDRSPKAWRKLFGKVPFFQTDFLGLFQACLKTRIRPREALDELRRDPILFGPMLSVVEAEGGPLPTPSGGVRREVGPTEALKMMGVALQMHLPRRHGFGSYYVDFLKRKGEADGIGPEQAAHQFMAQMVPIMFVALKMTGVLQRMTDGLIDGRPIVRCLPGEYGRFEVTGDGRGIPWLL